MKVTIELEECVRCTVESDGVDIHDLFELCRNAVVGAGFDMELVKEVFADEEQMSTWCAEAREEGRMEGIEEANELREEGEMDD